MIYTQTVFNFFLPTQTLASNIRGLTVTSNLNLIATTRLARFDLSVTNRLFIRDRADSANPIKNLSITNNLFLAQSTTRGPELLQVFDFLFFWHTISQVPYEQPKSIISFTQTIDVTKYKKPVISTIGFTQSITLTKTVTLSVTSEFVMANRPSVFKPDPHFVVGVDAYQVIVGPTVHLTDLVDEIYLRNPEFGDTERYEASRIMRRTRAGTLLMYRKPTWPTSRTLNYTFANLCPGTGQKIIAFLQKNLGRSFFLTTYEGITWKVICMTPAAELVQQMRQGQSITLEFQGGPL